MRTGRDPSEADEADDLPRLHGLARLHRRRNESVVEMRVLGHVAAGVSDEHYLRAVGKMTDVGHDAVGASRDGGPERPGDVDRRLEDLADPPRGHQAELDA